MEKKHSSRFIEKNTVFGIFVGASFIVAAWLFFRTGRPVSLEPALNNILLLLSICGSYIGVRQYREEVLGGAIRYGQALGACVYLIAVASLLYGVFVYFIYRNHPELLDNYLEVVSMTLREAYGNSPFLENMEAMLRTFTTATTVASAEVFNKLFTGFIFSLFVAGLLRRRAPISQ